MNTLPPITAPPLSQNGASQNQSQKSATGTTGVSAAVKRKLAADEVKFSKLNTDLKRLVGSIGGMLLTVGMGKGDAILSSDGMVVLQHHEKLCDDLTALSREHEYVYKGLSFLVEGSAWSLVIGDVLGIGVAMAVNHGVRIPFLSGSDEDVKKAQQMQILQLQQQIEQMQQQMQEAA